MERAEHDGVRLDAYRSCKGVWFDRHEIAAIWSLVLTAAVQRIGLGVGGSVASTRAAGAEIGVEAAPELAARAVLDALTYSPDLGVVIVEGAAEAASGALEVLAWLPDLAGVAADAAGAVFEVLLEIVAGILSGL